jgi:hypothetical protein
MENLMYNMAAPTLIVFDVNETLLDLETMEPTFQRIFGDKSAMRLWFADLILYSAALTVAGCYVPFTDIGSAVMKMLADTRGIKIGRRTAMASGPHLRKGGSSLRGRGNGPPQGLVCPPSGLESPGPSLPGAIGVPRKRR